MIEIYELRKRGREECVDEAGKLRKRGRENELIKVINYVGLVSKQTRQRQGGKYLTTCGSWPFAAD